MSDSFVVDMLKVLKEKASLTPHKEDDKLVAQEIWRIRKARIKYFIYLNIGVILTLIFCALYWKNLI